MGVSNLHLLDWLVLLSTLLFIVLYGVYKTRKMNSGVEDYIKGGKDTKWWTIGLSVMAAQASAITFLSTPGQAFHDGMGFVQFYFGLPIAMVIICLVFIPILSMNDWGEKPKKGSLLIAKYGKGNYIYTGLSFFRELPAGVSGAYKLFANILSTGKTNIQQQSQLEK